MEKMTYVKAIDVVLSGAEMTTEVREKLEALKDSLTRKATGSGRKMTKTQKQNETLKDFIFDAMEDGKTYTISEMVKEFAIEGIESSQKMQSLIRQMMLEGRVERTEVKGRAYFAKIVG